MSFSPDRAVIMQLDKRLESLPRVQEECQRRLGLQPTFCLMGDGKSGGIFAYDHVDVEPPPRTGYPAWVKRPNSYNASLAFRKVIAKAQREGIQELLLLEDDVEVVCGEVSHLVDRAYHDMTQLDPNWELFYLGANHSFSRTQQVSPSLLRLNGSGCFHAVCLQRRIFQVILELPLEGPIDGVVAKYLHPRLHAYACWPSAAITRSGFSYCEGREVDYSEFWGNRGRP